jgi:putative endonuclease
VKSRKTQWYVYIVRCADGTLYTGCTTDVGRRVAEHNGSGTARVRRGANYTSARRPVTLMYSKKCSDRSRAQIEEYRIKQLSRTEKEQLISNT